MKTSDWPALRKVHDHKWRVLREREDEHKQHVIDHGSPRERPDLWLAALIVMKANRIWNSALKGGSKAALYDSAIDLGNYADFLSAYLYDEPIDLGHPSARDYDNNGKK